MANVKFHQIGLIGKYASKSSQDLLLEIAQMLNQLGATVFIEESSLDASDQKLPYQTLPLPELGTHCDLVIVIGGDGTMLNAARILATHQVPLVGVNQGRLGFITDIAPASYQQALKEILMGEHTEDLREMIQATVIREGEEIYSALALNEIVINRTSTSNMVEVRVKVDDHFAASLRADGVIVSTATGSTAYALSANGPILSPGIKGWVMVPIAPHTLSNRPIIIPNQSTLTLEVVGGREASATFDNQSLSPIKHHDQIVITKSEQKVRFLHPANWSYYETLRNKLRWYAE